MKKQLEIRRFLTDELIAHLEEKEITLLIGPRQAGKTTLLKHLAELLQAEQRKTLFFNIDIERDKQHFANQETFANRLELLTGGEKYYVFIDEVQRLPNAGLFLKGIYDRGLPHKLIVTGSGSLELKEQVAESLVGRKLNFFLPTVSPAEFAHYVTDYAFVDRLSEALHQDRALRNRVLTEYLKFGGYPRVITAGAEPMKRRILEEIYQGYIERDIKSLLQLEKTTAFVTLLQLVANRSGYTVNYSGLATQTGLSAPTIKDYLWYAEKTFILEVVRPYFTNKEKEIAKAPAYYNWDVGLRNFLLGRYEDPSDVGMKFQTFVFRLLEENFRHGIPKIHFWQTKNKAEVDFVVNRGYDLLPVEVKYAQLKQPKLTRSYRSFLDKYQPKEGWIVNQSLRATIQIGETQVRFLPWYDLLSTNDPSVS
ncbi:MAG: ATP-binding protein [Bacteroidota bacterium]